MNLSKSPCSEGYNLSELTQDPTLVRVCFMQEATRKQALEAAAEGEGKRVSHGVCDLHLPDFEAYANS